MSSQRAKKVDNTKVMQILEDTGFAYTISCETQHLNTDYADFASTQALCSFKRALKNPNLTYDDLCAMLRRASKRASARQCKTPWSMFMANHIARQSNNNSKTTGTRH